MALFELTGVGYTVDGQHLLHDIDLSINAGDWLTLAGPSGAGKSTLLRVLATLLTPTAGSLHFAGQRQADYDKIAYRRRVSYCFQQPSLFGDTVRDNLAFPYQIRKRAFDAAKAVDALASVDLPADFLDKAITSLSGGEKQRVALIRNLLFKPEVLLLDEITTGLDGDTKAIVLNLIESLHHGGTTIIAVTHDEGEIAAAKQLRHMVAGTLQEESHA